MTKTIPCDSESIHSANPEWARLKSGLDLLESGVCEREDLIHALLALRAACADSGTLLGRFGRKELSVGALVGLHFGFDSGRLQLGESDYAETLWIKTSRFELGRLLGRLLNAIPLVHEALARGELECRAVNARKPLMSRVSVTAFQRYLLSAYWRDPPRWKTARPVELFDSDLLEYVYGYNTCALAAVARACALWRGVEKGGPYDPARPATWPREEDVVEAIRSEFVSPSLARAIFTITRPASAPLGRPPRRSKRT